MYRLDITLTQQQRKKLAPLFEAVDRLSASALTEAERPASLAQVSEDGTLSVVLLPAAYARRVRLVTQEAFDNGDLIDLGEDE